MFLGVEVESFITVMKELLHNPVITVTVSTKFCAEIVCYQYIIFNVGI